MQSGLLKTVNQRLAGPQTELQSGDIIYIIGEKAQTSKFVSDYRLAVVETQESEPEEGGAQLDFYDIGIAEIVMMPTSRLVNRKLKESGFRSKYHINIVGVRRKGQYIMDNLAELRLHGGDVLLVQGTWENISRLNRDEEDWVVLGQPLEEAEKVTLDYKAPLAACIMLLIFM